MARKKQLSGIFLTSKEVKKDINRRLKAGAGVVLGRLSTGLVMKLANKLSHDAQMMSDVLALAGGGALSAFANNPIIEGVGYGIAADAAYEMILKGDILPQKVREALGLQGLENKPVITAEDEQNFNQLLDQTPDIDDVEWEDVDDALQGPPVTDLDDRVSEQLLEAVIQEKNNTSAAKDNDEILI